MRASGFSTGALAKGDVPHALSLLADSATRVVELSALRLHEVASLRAAAPTLDLGPYDYVSVHAPSRYERKDEPLVVDAMLDLSRRGWPIILHPDTIHDFAPWRQLGSLLVIENMDKRKPIGRTVDELHAVFEKLPEASFCFDLGHARQVDCTMTEAYALACAFRPRLRQLHVSEVSTQSRHDLLSWGSVRAFQKVAPWIPKETPMILETPAVASQIQAQIRMAAEALPCI
ncbi:hypothetical protein [Chondromyces apiculatus]|uniref:Xylose isomerase-like TIM barrel domain-containing protein n=1 Tax=Chondromyces apiculatus DSM 436 TaxID=1192034 RepID=A0A017TJ31_9BACT|nr:hypothetical protein [Chondromyces apiculatus]EYF08902.1 Hypothetical protein CAP_2763 [Chondromyces apiculatus DSM 436]